MVVGSVLVGWGDWDSPAPRGIRNLRLWLWYRMHLSWLILGWNHRHVIRTTYGAAHVRRDEGRCHTRRSSLSSLQAVWRAVVSEEWPRLLPRRC